MEKVYVICASQGAYSDYSHWVVGVFDDEKKAEAALVTLQAKEAEIRKHKKYYEEIYYVIEDYPLNVLSRPED